MAVDLFLLSMCSKNVYSIVHQNKKYRKIFNHSKKIDGGFDLYGTFAAKTDEFFFKKTYISVWFF